MNWLKIIKKCILGLIVFYFLGIALIWTDGAISGYKKSAFAVVLGNQVYESGKPSLRLQARLNRAIELYNSRIVPAIIVSGGIGKEGHDEAKVMKRYLEAHKIPAADIIVDSNGYNTRLTADNAKQWADVNQPIIVVSQLYHISRSKMAFRQAGFKDVGAAYPLYFELGDTWASNRELFAWMQYYISGFWKKSGT